MTATAVDITAGAWVRFPGWEQWRWVIAAHHVPFRPSEPRASGYVSYDASSHAGGRFNFGGFATHDQPCRVFHITPQAVAS